MRLKLGVKSDPIEYRYSFDWLFGLMQRHSVEYLQLGSFFELYTLEDVYFMDLRAKAAGRGIQIKSCFSSHRELGGFFTGDPRFERCTRDHHARYIQVAALLGADYMGANPGAVYRESPELKAPGIERYLDHMREMMGLARAQGLKALTMETMSSLAEPPSTPEEIDYMISALSRHHSDNADRTVPVFLCGDISHGLADKNKNIICDNVSLFESAIPYMAEFHFKNTDQIYNATFGFDLKQADNGIVDLAKLNRLIADNNGWPVDEVVGYLEISGPKVGRDYSDCQLEKQLSDSIIALKKYISFD